MPKRKRTDPIRHYLDRFADQFAVTDDECWQWLGYVEPGNYARFYNYETKRSVLAHRWAYQEFIGPIPDGMQLDHLCRNRACVSPFHLEPVTPAENSRRGLWGALHVPTDVCRYGHVMVRRQPAG